MMLDELSISTVTISGLRLNMRNLIIAEKVFPH